LLGRASHNTIRLSNASHVVVRRLEVDGRNGGGFGVGTHGPANHITIEDNEFRGIGPDQQIVAISTTGRPTWGWVIRRNLIVGAGTGIYAGNSDGTNPFVAGLIEHNVIRDTLGYCMQVKHQVAWADVPPGMPTDRRTTVIRHNVFAKSAHSAGGEYARPNLLLGDQPPSGHGAANGFAVYGNFFHENPGESLFQAEGNVAFYDNLLVTSGSAVRVQRHNGFVRDVRIFHNTVVAGAQGIALGGGAPGYSQRVMGNAVFAGGAPLLLSGAEARAFDNVLEVRSRAADFLNDPFAGLGGLDLFPRPGTLAGAPLILTGLEGCPDADRDFNGLPRDPAFRGAYSGEGRNPGWTLALGRKS
jgi:hypothetical protein